MEDTSFELIKLMHQKFGISNSEGPTRLSDEERSFRIIAMQEELDEFIASESLVDEYDALLDLIVFAMGTLERMGLPFYSGFKEVMACNMSKSLGGNAKRGDFQLDLVKPADFVGPEKKLEAIIDREKK